ncbi:MAG: 3-dehydroquinate synthase [Spirochaetes bacterium]|nr:3-dehydroquinate synthase [Spirochaetota bacterium]
MAVVKVNLEKKLDQSYLIEIAIGSLKSIGEKIKELSIAQHYVIITDSTVAEHHLSPLEKSCQQAGLSYTSLVFPAGEANKNRKTKEQLENQMIELGIHRDSCIIALGGGVTGDLAGFIAATYQRGIPFIQIPTTLLSQVDSSIGGKVGLDTPLAKNMVGAFHQPKKVFIDIATLSTLPPHLRLNGIAEVIKHAIIFDKDYFEFIKNHVKEINTLKPDVMEQLIQKSCQIKSYIVAQDEKEGGVRKLLNFGHTIGHAVEVLMDFSLLHNDCIAIGMYYESLLAYQMGMLREQEIQAIEDLLNAFHLPVKIPETLKPQDILAKTYLDKKVRNNVVEYVLPKKIGQAEYNCAIKDQLVLEIFKNTH